APRSATSWEPRACRLGWREVAFGSNAPGGPRHPAWTRSPLASVVGVEIDVRARARRCAGDHGGRPTGGCVERTPTDLRLWGDGLGQDDPRRADRRPHGTAVALHGR